MMKYGSLLLIIFTLSGYTSSYAESTQSLDEITQVAKNYALQQASQSANPEELEIVPGELDPRLRLAKCQNGLSAFSPPGSRLLGNTTVGVKCSAPKAWSIYIPMRVSLYQQAIIVKQPVRRGEVITAADIQVEKVDVSLLRGIPFKDAELLIGSKAKNTLSPGTIINSDNVCVVCKGDSVSITASNSAIAVVMSGIALTDGSIGESIRVQNSASKRIVEAKVVNEDTVEVGI